MIINLTSYTHGTMKLPNKADTNLSHQTWYSKSPRSAKQNNCQPYMYDLPFGSCVQYTQTLKKSKKKNMLMIQ